MLHLHFLELDMNQNPASEHPQLWKSLRLDPNFALGPVSNSLSIYAFKIIQCVARVTMCINADVGTGEQERR